MSSHFGAHGRQSASKDPQSGRCVLVTGATGFIGVPLMTSLRAQGWHSIALVRDYARARMLLGPEVELIRNLGELGPDTPIDAIINLAGAGIADKAWSKNRKKELLESRLLTTRAVVHLIQRLSRKPSHLLSASAIGFYGASDAQPLNESAAAGEGFSHELCKRWEEEARKAEVTGIAVTLMRLGVVLAADGGMLGRLLPVFRLGLGGRTGSGQQYLSWIHRNDAIAAMLWLLEHPLSGVVNLTAPHAVTNAAFSAALAAQLHRPAIFAQPEVIVRAIFGEMGEELLLSGQNVVPARLQDQGFQFSYPHIQLALEAELAR